MAGAGRSVAEGWVISVSIPNLELPGTELVNTGPDRYPTGKAMPQQRPQIKKWTTD